MAMGRNIRVFHNPSVQPYRYLDNVCSYMVYSIYDIYLLFLLSTAS